jgi:hypothetical protein
MGAGRAQSVGLDGRGIAVRVSVGARGFSFLHNVQTGSGATPAFYPIGTGDDFPGDKATRA